MQKLSLVLLPLLVFSVFIMGNCKKDPYKYPHKNIDGFVIGKETCNIDASKDYWLIDFTLTPNQTQIGDTIIINGIEYTNVVKVKGLDDDLKQLGIKVAIDYDNVSPNKVESTGCNVPSPSIYALKELYIIYQGEIR